MVKVNTKYQEKTVTARSVGCLGSNENKPIRKVDFVKNAQSVDNVSKSTHKFDPMAIISEQSGGDIAQYVMNSRLELSEKKIKKKFTEVSNQTVMETDHFDLLQHEQSGQTVIDFVNESGGKTFDLKEKESWQKRMFDIDDKWNDERAKVLNNYLLNNSFVSGQCHECKNETAFNYVRCLTCKHKLCGNCDHEKHYKQPFHVRMLDTEDERKPLVSMDFVSYPNGEIYQDDVPVPCFKPGVCSMCDVTDSITVVPSKKSIVVTTFEGPFKLKGAIFVCSKCNHRKAADASDYISSGLWPGDPFNISYLMDATVYRFYYLLKHNIPSTSEMKVVQCLQDMSEGTGREETKINRVHFNIGSRQHDFINHKIDEQIKKQDKTACFLCGEEPIAGCIDGNRKLYRWQSAKGLPESRSLYGDRVIAKNEDFLKHTQLLSSLGKKKSSENCGPSKWKAAREDGSKISKLDEAGMAISCCRHRIILKAVNMLTAENFRHTSFLHNHLAKRKMKYICGDVMCKYKFFGRQVSRLRKDNGNRRFPEMIKSKYFLSRMHAKAHTWYCQILNVGHWQKGAGLTSGEEEEILNAHQSRYNRVTCHMGKGGRLDHMTGSFLFSNVKINNNGAKASFDRRADAQKTLITTKKEVEKFLNVNGIDIDQLPKIQKELILLAQLCLDEEKRKSGHGSLEVNQKKLEGLYAQWLGIGKQMKTLAVTSKERTVLALRGSEVKKSATKVIKEINLLTEKLTKKKNKELTMTQFEKGMFPWQLGDADGISLQAKIKGVDDWNLHQRAKEEILYSEKEMENYLLSIEKTKKHLLSCIEQLPTSHISSHLAKIDSFKKVVMKLELKKLDVLKTKSINIFKKDVSLAHITDKYEMFDIHEKNLIYDSDSLDCAWTDEENYEDSDYEQ